MRTLSPQCRQGYFDLYQSCVIRPERTDEVKAIAGRILAKQDRYRAVEEACGVPWYVVGIIHSLECDLNFSTHLHNGDPLAARTTHVPKGRPPGAMPCTWTDSALDALQYDGLTVNQDWSVAGILGSLEEYNGTGYRNLPNPIPSPYLWSFSNVYDRGKFDSDHRFDPNAISEQCGAAVLLRFMATTGRIALRAEPVGMAPLGIPVTATDAAYPGHLVSVQSATDKTIVQTLQERLNEVGCGPVTEDGVFSDETDEAVRLFQMRHTDLFGCDLEVDGEVGSLTWGALFGDNSVPRISGNVDSELLDRVVSVAASQIGVLENPLGSNRGPQVEQYQAAVGIDKGQPWCAAFVFWCFQQAASALGCPNPVFKTGSVVEHWNLARQRGIPIVLAERAHQNPELLKPGMIFVMATNGGSGHTGLIEKVIGGRLVTIEGNTNAGGSREGIGVFRRDTRSVSSINRGFIDYGTS